MSGTTLLQTAEREFKVVAGDDYYPYKMINWDLIRSPNSIYYLRIFYKSEKVCWSEIESVIETA